VISYVALLALALGLVTASHAAGAQPAGKVFRVGFLGNSTAALKASTNGSPRSSPSWPP
jgi:hypothetical protein